MFEKVALALKMAAAMGWLLLWPLIFGFAVSAAIQAVVSHKEMAKLLPDHRPRSLLRAGLLGAASSSCSYAAVAIARSMFRKGADFNAAVWSMVSPPTAPEMMSCTSAMLRPDRAATRDRSRPAPGRRPPPRSGS